MEYPTTARCFRRWAIPRLRWDLAKRNTLIVAYLGTLFGILFCPCRASSRIAIPDRWGRACRWAVGHVLVLALAATLLCNGHTFSTWIWHQVRPDPGFHPTFHMERDAPVGKAALWMSQSFAAWSLAFSAPILVGVLLSLGFPGRHRAAKLTGAKWSLYVAPVMLPTVAAWYAFHNAFPPIVRGRGPFTIMLAGSAPDIPLWLIGASYGLWWALGMCCNRYAQRPKLVQSGETPRETIFRVSDRFLHTWDQLSSRSLISLTRMTFWCAIFFALWLLLTRVVFPLGGLEAML